MRQSLSLFCNSSSNRSAPLHQIALKRAACLTALAALFTCTCASAREPAETDAKSNSGVKQAGARAPAEAGMLPECLAKLKLTASQQAQAKEIVGKYDAKINAVRKQSGERYMDTIKTEVSLLAAIEDSMTDEQRTKVRDQRRKTAHAEQAPDNTPDNTTEKPSRGKDKAGDLIQDEIAAVGVSLTSEQEAAADKIHHNYTGQLRALKRDMHSLHARLLSLEADKLVELEKMLTKDQLAQLREGRQTPPAAAKLTSAEKTQTQTE